MLFKWHFSKFSHMRKHKHGAFFHTFLFESLCCFMSLADSPPCEMEK